MEAFVENNSLENGKHMSFRDPSGLQRFLILENLEHMDREAYILLFPERDEKDRNGGL